VRFTLFFNTTIGMLMALATRALYWAYRKKDDCSATNERFENQHASPILDLKQST
jgi:hypothetical protein